MRDVNLYTTFLFTAGLYALFGFVLHFSTQHWLILISITLLIVLLDLMPVTLPSGVQFSSGSIGFLYLLYSHGLGSCVLPLLLGTLAFFAKQSKWKFHNINWFRYFSTVGMYFISVLIDLFIIRHTEGFNLITIVLLLIIAYELTNAFLLSAIFWSITGENQLIHLLPRIKELTFPVFISSIVLIRLLSVNSAQLIPEILYTVTFLMIIIFFSSRYIKQITAQKKSIQESNERYDALFERNPDFVFSLDWNGNFQRVNSAVEKILGYQTEEVVGKSIYRFVSHNDVTQLTRNFIEAKQGVPQNFEMALLRSNGEQIDVNIICSPNFNNGRITGLYGIAKDITEQKRAEVTIQHMAYYDTLTDLPNRRLFHDRLDHCLQSANESQHSLAVMMLDLDRFKMINDTLGHGFGDVLLKEVANRLLNSIGATSTISRFGGDEFVILLPVVKDKPEVEQISSRILKVFEDPIVVKGHELRITTSIGIAMYPESGTSAETLIQHADIAMYVSKSKGHNRYTFFDKSMNNEIRQRLKLEEDLLKAVENKEFVLYYQPQINIHSGDIVGVEALIRWEHPELGIIPPSQFISVLEQTGLIISLGEWILRSACEQMMKWKQLGLPLTKISVNLSSVQLQDKYLKEKVFAILKETGLDPHHLELEMTESVIMDNVEEAAAILGEFNEAGISIAIDDFGTGYSSLSYLTKLPIDTLKLDKSFVQNMVPDSNETKISAAIIELAHKLNMIVIAEGVDSSDKLGFLRKRMCDSAQGYLFSPPVPADIIHTLFVENTLGELVSRVVFAAIH